MLMHQCESVNLTIPSLYYLHSVCFFFLLTGVEGSIFDVFPQSLNVTDLQSCSSTADPWQPCACSYRLNLEWFPCQLKYCRGQRLNPYKCGIKCCSKGYRFNFYMPHKQLCI
uniref:OAF homolog b (Drosophila) n=1 Tax=Cyprinus carpio TaxID=7962 RepID=A0A8C1L7A3_CYPCA